MRNQQIEQAENNQHDANMHFSQQNTAAAVEKSSHLKKCVDFEKIPGDFRLAQLHKRATRVAPEKILKRQEKLQGKLNEKCDCCGRDVERESLNMNSDVIQLSYLGSGYPMFFQFQKLSIAFLAILFCISGIFNMVVNGNYGNQCIKKGLQCKQNWIIQYSLGNRTDLFYSIYVQECLNLTTVCVLIVFIQIIIYKQRRLDSDCDDCAIIASDYTVMVQNFPQVFEFENEDKSNNFDVYSNLKEFFQNPLNMNGEVLKVVKVNLGLKIKDLKQLEAQQKNLVEEKQKLLLKLIKKGLLCDVQSDEIAQLDKKIYFIKNKIEELEVKFRDGKGISFMNNHFTGVAFVTLETERMQKILLDLSKQTWLSNSKKITPYFGRILSISPAPDPTEIYWENLNTSQLERNVRIAIGLSIDFLVVFGSGLSIYFLQDYQSTYAEKHKISIIYNSQNNKDEITNIQLLSLAISIVIFIINSILTVLVRQVAKFKKFQTRTYYNLSFAFFLSLAQFTNATLVPFIVSFIVNESTNYQMLYGASGLIPNQNIIFMVNSFLPILFFFLDFEYILKKLQRKSEEKKNQNSILTQQELLDLYEDPQFTIEAEYSQVMNTLLMTLFYATPLPICVLWSIAGIIIQYLIAKYNLINRRSAPFNIGSSLSQVMINLLNAGILIFACLSYVFIYMSKDNADNNSQFISLVAIIVSAAHFVLPIHVINKELIKIKPRKPENIKSYRQVYGDFSTDYDRANPATKRLASQKFIQEQENINWYKQFIRFESIKIASNRQKQENNINISNSNIKIEMNSETYQKKQFNQEKKNEDQQNQIAKRYSQSSQQIEIILEQNNKSDKNYESELIIEAIKKQNQDACIQIPNQDKESESGSESQENYNSQSQNSQDQQIQVVPAFKYQINQFE
ncbi:transmembrane protein, putative (macronuclear) [Tetrahymena thermophila SB210]|uniref:Transmembrane protein, putative n=1 Tax=Tetrahymena thermophila (strain SB210) TaxID=312017 RepID=Q231V8_TETTS|nr:transmembrane protein, putative [Tetrahymena thermophila SB210]EAR91342.1 transmembrane protein, putative [Tetrahymena thermophila SB210]|eukprot:XP_001011587.1 transmembrane protein, putative [Tetrahymena thermophila SB210]